MSNARGLIKVELFCSQTGRKLNEVKKGNFIAKGMEYVYQIAMLGIFTKGKYTGGFDWENSIQNQFRYMYLTTADHDEDPENEWLIDGRIIGFSRTDATYSGDSEFQGSYNTSESFTTQEHVRIVVDFPTHAGNGEFQSIYFMESGDQFLNIGFERPFGNIEYVQEYDGYYYQLSGNGILIKRNMNFEEVDRWKIKNPYSSWIDGVIYNDNIYLSIQTVLTEYKGLWKVSLTSPEDELQRVYTTGGTVYGTTFDGEHFYMSHNNSSEDEIIKLNTSYELVDVLKPTRYNGNTTRGKMHVDDEGAILVNGYRLVNDDVIENAGIGNIKGITKKWLINNGDYLIPRKSISSRALLDSPVTKTENTTMKITYDFMLPPLY